MNQTHNSVIIDMQSNSLSSQYFFIKLYLVRHIGPTRLCLIKTWVPFNQNLDADMWWLKLLVIERIFGKEFVNDLQ